jgi:hypothetical protein
VLPSCVGRLLLGAEWLGEGGVRPWPGSEKGGGRVVLILSYFCDPRHRPPEAGAQGWQVRKGPSGLVVPCWSARLALGGRRRLARFLRDGAFWGLAMVPVV